MEGTKAKTYAPWFMGLMKAYNSKSNELQLDDEASSELRQLFIEKCREQYSAGNTNGIRWAHEQARKKLEEEAKISS